MNRRIKGRWTVRYLRTPEEEAWLNIAPVGREFGSPDFEKYYGLQEKKV